MGTKSYRASVVFIECNIKSVASKPRGNGDYETHQGGIDQDADWDYK